MVNPTLACVALNTVLGLRVIIFWAYRANVGHTSGKKRGKDREKGYQTRSRVLTSLKKEQGSELSIQWWKSGLGVLAGCAKVISKVWVVEKKKLLSYLRWNEIHHDIDFLGSRKIWLTVKPEKRESAMNKQDKSGSITLFSAGHDWFSCCFLHSIPISSIPCDCWCSSTNTQTRYVFYLEFSFTLVFIIP